MIPFNFVYCRPNSLKEAVDTFCQLQTEDKNPIYYSGGSEIITMCRAESIRPGAVIDLKNIPECAILHMDNKSFDIGSCCTLNQIKETKIFPLINLVIGRIADHTNQCRITLGGNLCGTIIYRESSLPLLISDAEITLFGVNGFRTTAFENIFKGRIQLNPDEFVVKVHIPKWALNAPYFHVKRTRNEKIDYPLISVTSIWKDNYLRIAFSGICNHPFRSKDIEAVLNDKSLSCTERVDKAIALLPKSIYDNVEGSNEYKIFVFRNTLLSLLEDWKNGKI